PTWARFLGLTVEELIGRTDDEMLMAENVRTLHNGEQSFLAAGGIVSSEKKLFLDGQTRVVLIDKTPFRDADGKIVGVIGVCRDITKLKQAQEQAQQRLEEPAHIDRHKNK
ncbi:MAG: PAS domain-containing protein, partial [Gammaproteobacteria bacterium]